MHRSWDYNWLIYLFSLCKINLTKISDVTCQDIHGTSATTVAMKFDYGSKYPCSRIKIENVKPTYNNQLASASCSHASGTASGLV